MDIQSTQCDRVHQAVLYVWANHTKQAYVSWHTFLGGLEGRHAGVLGLSLLLLLALPALTD